ncbi:uncharacterized protein LOC8268530 [Ricinus communis]|uniref:uncharacterized protein LOC8268530 n=1 Tax=Ricinus communis TaxID=3988 RepID=UPI00201ABAF1|nr:uncharacterized protein LOC8268530 [Ricinus communis]
MSRHRRQASQVLPPEIFTGNEPLGDIGQAIAGHHLQGRHGSSAAISERSTNIQHLQSPTTTATASPPSTVPAKNLPPAKPA